MVFPVHLDLKCAVRARTETEAGHDRAIKDRSEPTIRTIRDEQTRRGGCACSAVTSCSAVRSDSRNAKWRATSGIGIDVDSSGPAGHREDVCLWSMLFPLMKLVLDEPKRPRKAAVMQLRLDRETCWSRMSSARPGLLALTFPALPGIVPVRSACDGSDLILDAAAETVGAAGDATSSALRPTRPTTSAALGPCQPSRTGPARSIRSRIASPTRDEPRTTGDVRLDPELVAGHRFVSSNRFEPGSR